MKRINIITGALFAYTLGLSVLGWPGRNPAINYTEYFLILGGSLLVILLLRFVQIKRFRNRNKES